MCKPVLLACGLSLAAVDAAAQDTTALRDAVTLSGVRQHQESLQLIADANGGTRKSGTPGDHAAAAYVSGLLESAGYSVETQSIDFLGWYPLGPSTLEQVAPSGASYIEGVDFRQMAFSAAGEVTAEVTPVDLNLVSLELSTSACEPADFAGFPPGNIALVQRGTCSFQLKAELAAAAGASAVIIMNSGLPGQLGVIPGTLGSTYAGGIPVVSTTFDLGVELATTPGVVLHLVSNVFTGTLTTSNVIATTPSGNPDKVVVVAETLDCVLDSPGINANGSGVAAVLEIALQMANLGMEPTNQVKFCFWGGSFEGQLGSEHFLDTLSPTELAAIRLALAFDAIGSPNFVRFVYDGDGSEGGPVSGLGSSAIESTLVDYFADASLGGGLATEPVSFEDSELGGLASLGIPVGGLFGGTRGVKTPEQAAVYGGTPGDLYDPCVNQACDTFANYSAVGLEQMSDAAAHCIAVYAASTAPLAVPAVEALEDHVASLGLPDGAENALLVKLQAAQHAAEEGRTGAAIRILNAFVALVEARLGSFLSQTEVDELIAMAEAIIESLE